MLEPASNLRDASAMRNTPGVMQRWLSHVAACFETHLWANLHPIVQN
jgi:hypothetical protein